MSRSKEKTRREQKVVTQPLELSSVEGGTYKPKILCEQLAVLQRWREDSARANGLY